MPHHSLRAFATLTIPSQTTSKTLNQTALVPDVYQIAKPVAVPAHQDERCNKWHHDAQDQDRDATHYDNAPALWFSAHRTSLPCTRLRRRSCGGVAMAVASVGLRSRTRKTGHRGGFAVHGRACHRQRPRQLRVLRLKVTESSRRGCLPAVGILSCCASASVGVPVTSDSHARGSGAFPRISVHRWVAPASE